MSSYASTASIAQIADRIRGASHIAVLTHARPDGDAAGSVLAAVRAMRAVGLRAKGYFCGSVDPNIQSLAQSDETVHGNPPTMDSTIDLALLVDTGSWNQVEPLDGWLKSMAGRVVGLDHHGRGDPIASDRVVDTTAAAATQVVAELVDALGIDLRQHGGRHSIAEALFVGLATDTGWFRFESVTPAVLALASRLLAAGVDHTHLHQVLEENGRPARLGITARALSSVTLHREGRIAIMLLGESDFAATGAGSDDIGGIVNIPLTIRGIEMSCLLSEQSTGITKCSFRSKPMGEGHRDIDVNAFAAQFGGGGHVRAAGARIAMPLAQARARVESAVAALDIGGRA
jgi:phosphoesterase RecJ-like protein